MKIQIEFDYPIEEISIRAKPMLSSYVDIADCPECDELARKANEEKQMPLWRKTERDTEQ